MDFVTTPNVNFHDAKKSNISLASATQNTPKTTKTVRDAKKKVISLASANIVYQKEVIFVGIYKIIYGSKSEKGLGPALFD